MFCADVTLSLCSQALAILQLLSNREVAFAECEDGKPLCRIESRAWYNGREKGVVLVVQNGWVGSGPCFIVAFGEDRVSDKIFIDRWYEPEAPFNGPTIDLRGAHGKGFKREVLKANETARAADRIYDLMAEFIQSKGKVSPMRKGRKS